MNTCAFLLILTVQIYADGIEGPTGARPPSVDRGRGAALRVVAYSGETIVCSSEKSSAGWSRVSEAERKQGISETFQHAGKDAEKTERFTVCGLPLPASSFPLCSDSQSAGFSAPSARGNERQTAEIGSGRLMLRVPFIPYPEERKPQEQFIFSPLAMFQFFTFLL
ncbi:hypothetical protein JOQ06_025468, partial [Pogonophryne albipinna]